MYALIMAKFKRTEIAFFMQGHYKNRGWWWFTISPPLAFLFKSPPQQIIYRLWFCVEKQQQAKNLFQHPKAASD